MQLTFSTTYPQTDRQPERSIQELEGILRACRIDFGGHWDKFLPLCKFSYNNNDYSSIDMTSLKYFLYSKLSF